MYMFKRLSTALLSAVLVVPMVFLFSCEPEVDDLPSKNVPKDGGYFDITSISVGNKTDLNGNGYYPIGDVAATVGVNSNAPEGYSKTVYVTLSLQSLSSPATTILGKTGNISLSKGGATNTVNFQNVNFSDNIDEKGDYNLSIDIVEASSGRRILSNGFLGQNETISLDSTITYELQDVIWSTGIDSSGDGYYSQRSFETRVVSLGNSGTVANVTYWLQRSYRDANGVMFYEDVPLGSFPNYNIQRKGFGDVITGDINSDNLGIIRSEYSWIILAVNASNVSDTLLFQILTRDATKKIAFENTTYDFREYTINSVAQDSLVDNDGDGHFRSINFAFSVQGPALIYDTTPGTVSPIAILWYTGPATGGELQVYTSQNVTPGMPSADVSFRVEDLDSGLYDFEIDIRENTSNIVVSSDPLGLLVQHYDQTDFAELGSVPIEKNDDD
jgi:hypothetical protein